MIENLPEYIPITFALTTFATLLLFVWVIKSSNSVSTQKIMNKIVIGLTIWLVIQANLTINNVYKTDLNFLPPKIMLFGILPTIFTIFIIFATPKGREFLDSLPLKQLTYLNVIRIPVEIVLFWIFLNKGLPELMTFQGRNFDIIAGISAPFIAHYGFNKNILNKQIILIWNIICLGLLINIVVNAILCTPSPIQRFAFEQPNIAILNFPFSWLATFIVPIVLFGHLASIRELLKNQNKEPKKNYK